MSLKCSRRILYQLYFFEFLAAENLEKRYYVKIFAESWGLQPARTPFIKPSNYSFYNHGTLQSFKISFTSRGLIK